MKDKIKRILNTFLAILMLFTTLTSNVMPVLAQENELDGLSELDTITELGPLEEVFPQLNQENSGIAPYAMTSIGARYAKIFIPNEFGFDYISHLYVDGQTVFCIEPMKLFDAGLDYSKDTVKWDELSEYQRQAIWEINYYGYSYPGHQTDKYYVATQLMIWEVVDKWYNPVTWDTNAPYEISNEVATINSLRNQPQGRPSFANQTVKMGLNTPVTLTDTKGTLSEYSITSGNGISASASGNNLTVSITSENYDNQITFKKKYSARDVNIIYGKGGAQRVIYLANRKDPTPNFKINFELMYSNIEIEKQDSETGKKPQGDASFNGTQFAIKDEQGNTLETLTTNGSKVTSKKYPVGTTLNVCEVGAPEGYLNNSTCNSVKLEYDGDSTPATFKTVIKDDVIKGKIEIAKTIENENKFTESAFHKPGVGFKFDIILKSSGKVVETLTTDKDGKAISSDLPYGTYIVKEQDTIGYETLEPFEVVIDQNQKTYFYNVFNGAIKAELDIYKIDAETGKRIPAAGVEFKIKDSEGNFIKQTITYPNKYTTDVFKTDENGAVHLPEALRFGEYKLVEIKAPYGYVLSNTEIPINVDGTSTEIFINFENKTQKGHVYVEKFGEILTDVVASETDYGTLYTPVYTQTYLDGVTYQITAREDIVTPEGTVWYHKGDVVDTFTTGHDVTLSTQLQLGKYSIKEIETKTGYVLDTNTYDFDIEYAGQLIDIVTIKQAYVNERQKLDLKIQKTFEDDNKDAYKDVIFGVYSKNEIIVNDDSSIPADGLLGLITLDENGQNIEQIDLPIGEYYVKELETNVGYVLNEEKHEFTFAYGDTTLPAITVELNELVNNKRRLDIEINKVDSEHHDHFLNGALFEVFDKTTGEYVTSLCSGNLMIKGEENNEEYEISKDETFDEIIGTYKTNENKEIIVDLDDGTYYSRKVGSEETTRHVVKDGKVILCDAIYGHEYEFKEVKAPTSYQLSDKTLAVEVIADKETNTLIYIFENDRIVVPNTGV